MIVMLSVVSLGLVGFTTPNAYGTTVVLPWNSGIQYDDAINPGTTTRINVGDTIEWDWVNGNHDLILNEEYYTILGIPFPADANIEANPVDTNKFGDPNKTSDSNNVYSFTFNTPGTYVYYCSVHGFASQHGIVIVEGPDPPVDLDEDGFTDDVDCDDNDPAVHTELTYYLDDDSDGFGDFNSSQLSCNIPADHVLDSADCNDGDPLINPDAFDIPGDGIDQDCSGSDASFPIVTDPFTDIAQGDITIGLQEIPGDFVSPVHLTHAGDGSGRMFVVDQPGQIRIIDASDNLLPTPFLDVSSDIVDLPAIIFGDPVSPFNSFDERGLLGLAFHPDYTNSDSPGFGKLYTYSSKPVSGSADFTVVNPEPFDHQSVVSEWSVSADPNIVDPTSEREIMRVDEPQFNHDGGQLEFGPDGYLYVTFGDGGGADDNQDGHGVLGNGQDTSNILGSIIRIDPLDPSTTTSSDPVSDNGKYRIPSDNPFLTDPDSLDEIFAYGLRNAWRMSFDPFTDNLIAADVGQNVIEEINIITKGGNYGWNLKEGSFRFLADLGQISDDLSGLPSDLIDPVAEYDHGDGISITGGYVYNGNALPVLTGLYVFGDFSTAFFPADGRLFYTDLSDGLIKEFITDGGPINTYVKSSGQDENGELYFLAGINIGPLADADGTTYGKVLRVVPSTIDTDGDGYTTDGSGLGPDCNDNNSTINPGATEVWNGVDDDCDGTVDNGFTISLAKGQSPEVNTFLSYGNLPDKSQTGVSSIDINIWYGPSTDPETFTATLNRVPITLDFNPTVDGRETISLSLEPGRNVLILSIDGLTSRDRTATDTDRLTFVR